MVARPGGPLGLSQEAGDLAKMEGGEMAEGEGDGVPRQGGADLERSRVGRGPSTAREEVGGQERFLPRP